MQTGPKPINMSTKEAVMTTQEVANRFNELAQEGNWEKIQEELYSQDAESIEPAYPQAMPSVKGINAIKEKGKKFNEMVEEMHGGFSKEPIVSGNHLLYTWEWIPR